MSCNKLGAAILLLFTASFVHAQMDRWIGLTRSEDGTEVKASQNTIKTVMGDRVTIWTLVLGGPPRRFKSGEVATFGRKRWFADCSKSALGLVETLEYNDSGTVVLRNYWEQPDMEVVRRESVGAIIVQFACDSEFRQRHTEWYENPLQKAMPEVTVGIN